MAAALAVAALAVGAPAASADEVVKKTLSFDVMVGPKDDVPCTVVADLYAPAGASAASPVPAILATNGFGGSKDDFSTLAPSYAKRGYAFLAYSGLGFGGSGCKITLDDPDYDGKAGSQLVSFLAGTKAAKDGTKIDYVKRDAPGDPRVGMIGGSYGGQNQFAVAGIDKRVDALNPQITWNDLSYSLSPNNTAFTSGVTYGYPGVVKIDWPTLFTAVGVLDGLQQAYNDQSHVGTCPNFTDEVCQALLQGASRGYLDDPGTALLRHASVASYLARIRIPTFLSQGQSDNLFDLQESVATYEALRAQGTPVKLLWRSAGHSGGSIGAAESDSGAPEKAYESRMSLEWFDHYLKGTGAAPRLDFSFLTDWLPYQGDAAPSVGSTASYPAGTERKLYLSGTGALASEAGAVQAGDASMASPGSAPASTGGGVLSSDASDAPGTFVAYATKPLESDLDLAGVASLTVRLDAPTFAGAASADPAGALVLFAKLYDVAPDGTITLPRNLVSAVRVADPSKPVSIGLPGIVHRFAKGHVLKLVLATTSATYRGSVAAGPVTVKTDPTAPGELRLPVLGAPSGPAGSGPDGTTPYPSPASAATAPVAKKAPAAARRFQRSCAGRTVRFRLRAAARLKVARVSVNGKRVRTIRRAKTLRRGLVVVRHLPRGKVRVVVTSTGKHGGTRRSVKRFAACG
jgi:ABC-2 type transport system ATP-binding protein